jgi:Protein of unknown function (DUF3631)
MDEDSGVLLLGDIRDVFNSRPGTDRLGSALIVAELVEKPDGHWSDWRGPHGRQTPHRLSQGGLAHILAPFGIRPKTIWPARRGALEKSVKGYHRSHFERAWAAYCDEAGTSAQGTNIRYLHNI